MNREQEGLNISRNSTPKAHIRRADQQLLTRLYDLRGSKSLIPIERITLDPYSSIEENYVEIQALEGPPDRPVGVVIGRIKCEHTSNGRGREKSTTLSLETGSKWQGSESYTPTGTSLSVSYIWNQWYWTGEQDNEKLALAGYAIRPTSVLKKKQFKQGYKEVRAGQLAASAVIDSVCDLYNTVEAEDGETIPIRWTQHSMPNNNTMATHYGEIGNVSQALKDPFQWQFKALRRPEGVHQQKSHLRIMPMVINMNQIRKNQNLVRVAISRESIRAPIALLEYDTITQQCLLLALLMHQLQRLPEGLRANNAIQPALFLYRGITPEMGPWNLTPEFEIVLKPGSEQDVTKLSMIPKGNGVHIPTTVSGSDRFRITMRPELYKGKHRIDVAIKRLRQSSTGHMARNAFWECRYHIGATRDPDMRTFLYKTDPSLSGSARTLTFDLLDIRTVDMIQILSDGRSIPFPREWEKIRRTDSRGGPVNETYGIEIPNILLGEVPDYRNEYPLSATSTIRYRTSNDPTTKQIFARVVDEMVICMAMRILQCQLRVMRI